MFAWIFSTSWSKMEVLNPNELILLLGVLTSVPIFGENRSRNATVTVRTDGYTDRRKTGFYRAASNADAVLR